MGKVIDFSNYAQKPDINSMDKPALLQYLEQLRAQIAELDAAEPKNMESEEYEVWGEQHEDLEDLVDEVMERLEELE